jgi:hypothetical protein
MPALCQTSNDVVRSSLYMGGFEEMALVVGSVVGCQMDVEEALR